MNHHIFAQRGCIDFVERVFYMVHEACLSIAGEEEVDLSPILGAIAMRSMRAIQGDIASKRYSDHVYGSPRDFFKSYVLAIKEQRKHAGHWARPLIYDKLDEGLVLELFGAEPEPWSKGQGHLDKAINQQQFNLRKAQSALASLLWLNSLVASGTAAEQGKLLDRTTTAARIALWQHMNRYRAALMELALIQGDLLLLQQLREWVWQSHYTPEHAIEHLLARDGRLPGRVDWDTLAAFRQEMTAALSKSL